jgi:hypothetical protein
MAAIMLVGLVAYQQLPVSALPEVDFPTIQIVTFYPGASPDVMASAVTAPLERQFGQVPGLNQMTSISSGGSSVITLQFALYLNIDVAEQEVQAAINAAQTYLPADLPAPPIYSKSNPADAPILTLALTSKTIPLSQVEDLADTRLAQKISQLSGVGLVTIVGGQKPAVRMQANPTQLSAYGMNLEDCAPPFSKPASTRPRATSTGPPFLSNRRQRPTQHQQGLQQTGRRLSQWLAHHALRRGQGGGWSREHQASRLDEQHSRHHRQHPAPAGRQHHPGGGPHHARLPQLKTTLPPSVDVPF